MVLQRAGKKYSVNWSNIKKNTKERGVDDASKLPHYHYRDDGFKIRDAIEAYAGQIIGLFYVDDAAVSGDKELQMIFTTMVSLLMATLHWDMTFLLKRWC